MFQGGRLSRLAPLDQSGLDLKGACLGAVAQSGEADCLQNQAQRHRRQAEAVVTDRAHTYDPGDDHWQEGQPGELAIDPFEGAEPEEADKEE